MASPCTSDEDGLLLAGGGAQRLRCGTRPVAGAAVCVAVSLLCAAVALHFGAAAGGWQRPGLDPAELAGRAELAGKVCAGVGENCSDSQCCSDPMTTCYRKNFHFAACREWCVPGIHNDDPPGHRTEWSCEHLGPPCAGKGRNCSASHCCSDPTTACYRKNGHFAACREWCTPGLHDDDPPGHRTEWSCELLGKPQCAAKGSNCAASHCCSDPTTACYRKNDHFAACRAECTPGLHDDDPPGHRTEWSCELLGKPQCAGKGQNCSASQCCSDPTTACYKKNDHFAACREECTPGLHDDDPLGHRKEWSCELLGEMSTKRTIKAREKVMDSLGSTTVKSCDCDMISCDVGDICQYCPDQGAACCSTAAPTSKLCSAWQVV